MDHDRVGLDLDVEQPEPGVLQQIKEIAPHKDFAAAERQEENARFRELIEYTLDLVWRQGHRVLRRQSRLGRAPADPVAGAGDRSRLPGVLRQGGLLLRRRRLHPVHAHDRRALSPGQFLITGVLGPNSNAHGPNEFLHVPYAKKLTACLVRIIQAHAETNRV